MNDLGTPQGYLVSGATAINNSNQIVGYTNGEYQSQYAYICENNIWTYLGTLPDLDYSVASDINDSHQIVGSSFMLGPGGGSRGWILEDSVMSSLGTLGGERSWASAINEVGEVVGYAQIYDPDLYIIHACLWIHDAIIDLGVLPGETNSAASDINDNGQVCGSSSHQQTTYPFLTVTVPCVWDDGDIIELKLLPGYARGAASGINNDGQVIGWMKTTLSGGISRAFIWENGVMTNLNDLIPDGSGWVLESASDINDAGLIVGTGEAPNGETHAFLLTPIPTDAPELISSTPSSYLIAESYPNPFNARTIMNYSLPEASTVKINVYDQLGREVQTLVDEYQTAGNYRVTWNADNYSSGIYFYSIQAADYVKSGRMTLLK
jgi:probable HAF family extracellular repeat protein